MQLQATLTKDDLQTLVAQLSPLRVGLGQKGQLTLAQPSGLALVADRGLRVVCAAQVLWEVLGVSVPVSLKSLSVMVEPSVESRADTDFLVFKMQIESADIVMVPALIGDRLTELVNAELAEKRVELSWSFGKTLSHVFRLPAVLQSLVSIGLTVSSGSVRVTDDALVFCVSFVTAVGRRPQDAVAPS
jgi:hypothetical protein